MNELKQMLLEMMVWFHDFCESNGLRYYMIGGTMLGAVRHKGFIPWDDDIDVGMPRSDYNRLEEIMGTNIYEDRFILETPNSEKKDFIYTFSKLYNVNTTLVERSRRNIVRGIYIDIFPIDGIGNSKKESIKNYAVIARKLDFLACRVLELRSGRKWYKNCAIKLLRAIPDRFVDEKQLIKDINDLCASRDFDEYKYVGNLPSTWRTKDIHKRENFGTPTLYEFEGHFFYGPEKYNDYLTTLYGNWNELPPIEKRASNHERETCDLCKAYIKEE